MHCSLVLLSLVSLALCAQHYVAIEAVRNFNTFTPNGVVVEVGDTVTWHWNPESTRLHNVYPEDVDGPRCKPAPLDVRVMFPNSDLVRGNNSLGKGCCGFPTYTWTVSFTRPGNFPYYCSQVSSLASNHCFLSGQRGNVVSILSGFNRIHRVNLTTANTFSPSDITINQGDAVLWTWAQALNQRAHSVISEGSTPCSYANDTIVNSTRINWRFPESSAWAYTGSAGYPNPTWAVRFETPGTFPYFSDVGPDCASGMRGVIRVLACPDCMPTFAPLPTPVPLGQDPVNPGRRVKGIDNWVLWTTVAYLCILGVLIIAVVVACVIGSKKSDGPVIAVCLLPSEEPAWANVKI